MRADDAELGIFREQVIARREDGGFGGPLGMLVGVLLRVLLDRKSVV